MTVHPRPGGPTDGRRPTPTGTPPLLVELAARQAALTPAATAVLEGRRSLGYAALEARANRLAHRLRDLGAGPGTLVGVRLHRGIDLVAALLAVWKAGAGYVPLDPALPRERLRLMLDDTAVPLVVTAAALDALPGAEAPRGTDPVPVLVDDDPALGACPDTDPGIRADPDGVAYAIHTSGSTGRPKCVLVTHRGIANRVLWTVRAHGLSAADRVLHKTTIGFDAACWEVFAPLVSGGSVALAPVGAELDPAALVRSAAELRATVLQVVPSVLRLLVAEPGWRELPHLRLLFCAGEALHAELARRALDAAGRDSLAVWNTYGPTECAIDVTAHRHDPAQTGGPVPIGRPLPGLRVLLLDAAGRPVPIGVDGELHAGGAGVARGYLGRPAATAERFVPDPYGPPGARLYRTGDLARWRPDGTLEYRGRIDDQTKVNGVRVEPGEIEAALAAHPEVTGAAVTAAPDRAGAVRLTGYVVTRDGRTPGGLRAFLRDRLPPAMVPAALIALDAFPLTPNGKVDRRALPAPADAGARPAHVAPRTPAEAAVADTWQRLLGADRVGAHDDFFQLGGDSLMLTRLAAGLRRATGSDLPLGALFTAATVEEQARLLTAADPADTAADPIRPVPDGGPLPLSFGQQRLRFLDRLDPGGPEWVSPLLLALPDDTTHALVQRCLDALEARHAALRTRYPADGARQTIAAPGRVELAEAAVAPDGLGAATAAQFARGFDLESGPLWRALLLRVTGRTPVLVLTLHHIACDGWSSAILKREFHELYAAFAEGRAPRLERPAVRYADFAAWQRARLTEQRLAPDLAFWRETLDGHVTLPLPTDRPRPAERDHRGAVVPVHVPAPLADDLDALGRRHGATPFLTLLTGFAALLARYSGEWDVTVGTPVAGRTRPETEGVVGFFLNSLPLRCALRPDITFEEALGRVRDVGTAAFAHQDLPFERLVEAVQGDRDRSRTPVYQVAFDLHDAALTTGGADLDGLDTFREAWRIAKTDLTLFLGRGRGGALEGVLEYAVSLFDDTTVQRLADHLVRLLAAVAEQPATRLRDIRLLSPSELRRQTAELNSAPAEDAPDSVLEMFEAQAAKTPDASALRHAGGTTTFAALDERANRLAHHLRASGVGPESPVAVLLDRGPGLPAAFLAVWKAGGGYVPLDPAQPVPRLAAVLAESGARTLVTTAAHAERLGTAFDGATIALDRDRAAIDARPGTGAGHRPDARSTAYTVFTSGSTGRPKGVRVEHRGLAHHVAWAARALAGAGSGAGAGAGTGDGGAPLFSSTAFDLVVPNLYAPLAAGQPVHLLPAGLDLARLGAELAAGGPYSFVKLTPGHLEILAEQLTDAEKRALAATVLVAGEALPGPAANRWLAALGPGRLINEYGPTECTVGTCVHPVDAPVDRAVVPIGRPLPGMAMYVLDEELRPQPTGVPGELYVGGTGVARGYAGQPAATARQFVPDPYGPPGARLYRTGDLVRLLPDGAVDFLGRLDHQVKIRGHRIEPDEIATALCAHPDVREAAVVALDGDGPGGARLAAYVVPTDRTGDGARPDAGALAGHCAALLPDYMVPAVFHTLDALPLTANGKLDRAALPRPETAADAPPGAGRPLDVVEERISEIWAELLGAAPGVDDDFFRTGGNSILAIRLISRVQGAFDVGLPLRAIFESPTVARLAAAVTALVQAEIDAMSDAEVLADPALPTLKEHDA
ncbi:amino acid adenylation domain-containing protein [Streptomyces sp. NPDC050617]|uniref:amino acid adenylation domain-containing protein n=1 Tax=Streptomyces sp. NPDC050617 TaxID=3154628 RepID=UPI00342FE1D6